MPRIDNVSLPNSLYQRPFKKKSYRPWNLLDDNFSIEKQNEHKADTKQTQTKHEPNTNETQNEHKQDTKEKGNILPTHKVDTKQPQIEHKQNTKPHTRDTTNQTQNEHKIATGIHFFKLVGLQKKVILFLYENCKKIRSKETEPLTLEHIAAQLSICLGSIKTTIRRLQLKSFIKRIDFKNGRSGWSRYEVPDNIFSEIMQLENEHKININTIQSEHKLNTKLNTDSYSSSSNNYKTTTTDELQFINQSRFPIEWQNMDIEPLSPIGFTKTHLFQIASQNKLSSEIVQDSIYAFAFDLQENGKEKSIKGDPINFFMGILRTGRVYTFPSNYESPQDKALRLYRENKRVIEQRRVEAEKEAINLAFNDWFEKLNDEQKIEFLPKMLRNNASSEKLEKSKILESSAKSYFEKEIWPSEKGRIVANKI